MASTELPSGPAGSPDISAMASPSKSPPPKRQKASAFAVLMDNARNLAGKAVSTASAVVKALSPNGKANTKKASSDTMPVASADASATASADASAPAAPRAAKKSLGAELAIAGGAAAGGPLATKGSKDFSSVAVRAAATNKLMAGNTLAANPHVMINSEYRMLCNICISVHGRLESNLWTGPGCSRVNLQAINEHNVSVLHMNALKKELQKPIEEFIKTGDESVLTKDLRVVVLIRAAYYLAASDRPISDIKQLARLMAANKTPDIELNGPYQSATACKEMILCISEVLFGQMKQELAKASAVGVLVDESTDRGRSHNLAVYVSYVGHGFQHQVKFLKLVELGSTCDAQALEKKLLEVLEEFGVDPTKVLSFTSDGASVMSGKDNGLAAKMKVHSPHMLSTVCMAHKLALCVANLFATFDELVQLDAFVNTITNYFAFSANRKAALEELLEELEEELLSVLQVHKVRWLSRERVVSRLCTLYGPLMDYFKEEAENNEKGAEAIYDQLREVGTMFHLYCVRELLAVISTLTETLQSRDLSYLDVEYKVLNALQLLEHQYTWQTDADGKMTAPQLPGTISRLMKELKDANGLWRGEHWLSVNGKEDIEWFQINKLVTKELRSLTAIVKSFHADVKARMLDTVDVAKNFTMFDPNRMAVASAGHVKSIYGDAELGNLLDFYGKERNGQAAIVDAAKCVQEWRIARPALLSAAATAKTRKPTERIAIREFWALQLFSLTEFFPSLTTLVGIMLVLQATSVEVERGFSTQNLIKTKLRTSLVMSSLDSLMRVSLLGPELGDWDAFDKQVLVPTLELWFLKTRVPNRSSHAPRVREQAAAAE